MEKSKSKKEYEQPRAVAIIIAVLIFVGIILWPIHVRLPLLRDALSYYGLINYLVCAAVIIVLAFKRDYRKEEIVMIILWIAALIPLIYSNRDIAVKKTIVAITNCWFPYFLIIYRGRKDTLRKVIVGFLAAFDFFIVLLMCVAVFEKITGCSLMEIFVNAMTSHGYRCTELSSYMALGLVGQRFCSLWGHPLTNAILFNMFFIMNDIYFRSIGKKYPKIVFFAVSLMGVLLCAGKTAIVVLGVYLIISSWNEKKWLIAYAGAAAVFFLAGGFNAVIARFSQGSLTTGRLETMEAYFSSGIYPLQFWHGYGSGTTYIDEMYHLKAGFEFPFMMFSLDYGILFACIMILPVFIYASWHLLKNRQIVSWFGYALLFAQIQTYNGISLNNQDICCMLAVFTMIVLNSVYIGAETKE